MTFQYLGILEFDVNNIGFPIWLLNPSFVVRVKIWLWIFQALILSGSDKIHLWSLNFNQLTGTITPAYMKVLKDGSDFIETFGRDKNWLEGTKIVASVETLLYKVLRITSSNLNHVNFLVPK